MSGFKKLVTDGLYNSLQALHIMQPTEAGGIEVLQTTQAEENLYITGAEDDRAGSGKYVAEDIPCKPVQIVNVDAHDPNEPNSSRFALNKDELEPILSKVGSRPVAVVSIAGPTRQGKSFILNFMIKYLQHGHSSSPWMTSGSTPGAENGFKWSCGSDPETMGIWMWPEPFFTRTAEEKEVAILLVDTQGVFDPETDPKDWGTIVGLSLLTSSCLIFNIQGSLKEDILIHLKQYLDFSRIASDPKENNKSFQKLVFLIRDWQFKNYVLGNEGGSAYLSSVFSKKQTECGKQIREQIQECFDHISCYLMPYPGPKVFEEMFNGSVTELNKDFADHVEKFVPWLFRCPSFLPKLTSGFQVTGKNLLYHYEEYIKIFNSDKVPTSKELNQAQVAIQNQKIIRDCIAIYEQTLRSIRQTYVREFLTETEKQRAHEEADACAWRHWNEARKMGSDVDIKEFENILLIEIKKLFSSLSAKNENYRFGTVSIAINNLKTFFTNQMTAKIKNCQQGPDNFVIAKVLNGVYKECKSSTENRLLRKLQLKSIIQLTPHERETFNNFITSLMANIKSTNWKQHRNAVEEMNIKINDLAAEYKQGLEKITARYKYWTPLRLQRLNTAVKDKLITRFESDYRDSSLFKDGQTKLNKDFLEKLADATRNAKLHNELYLKDCEQQVADLVKLFSDDIEKHLSRAASCSLKMLHEYIASFQTKLRNFKDFDRLPSEKASCFLSNLSTRLTTSYNSAWRKAYPLKRKTLLKQTKAEMYRKSAPEIAHYEKSLMKVLQEVKQNAITEFLTMFKDMQFESGSTRENSTTMTKLKDFQDEVDNCITELMNRNALNRKALQENIKGDYYKALSSYTNAIDEINVKLYNSDKYLELSQEAKDLVVETFQNSCKVNSSNGDATDFFRNLLIQMERLPKITRSEENIIEIQGPSLNFSTELNKLEKAASMEPIQQVNWIATEDITLDEDICGEFWSGKNSVVCAPLILVSGIERIIDVSGKKGNSAETNVLAVPMDYGACGQNGKNGEPGESGGNVAIFAHEIRNAKNLCIISNGGAGGNGQPGGVGANGINGIDGDARFFMSLDNLLKKFPSPAKFRMALRTEHFDVGHKSLKELANGKKLISKEPLETDSSIYWGLTTSEGAVIQYAFFEGLLKGRLGMRSFYVWCQGAPGTNGQPGGFGGHGGNGGSPGHSGNIHCPVSYKKEISVTQQEGISGSNGEAGAYGKDGIDGKQGTDYAYLDPYAGWSPISSTYEIQKFSGNLNIRIGRKADDGKWDSFKFVAYCPYRQRNITFVDSKIVRNVEVVHHPQQQVEPIAAAKPVMNKPIDIEYFNDILKRNRLAEKLKLEFNTI